MAFTWAAFCRVAGRAGRVRCKGIAADRHDRLALFKDLRAAQAIAGSMSLEGEVIGRVAIYRRHYAISPVTGLTVNAVHCSVNGVARN